MRIIGGNLKGIFIKAPDKLPVRPTTDMAKEALFNILNHAFDFGDCDILDLFSGTGNISIEFASRNAKHITAVDKHPACVQWIKSISQKHQLSQIKPLKADVFKYLQQEKQQYDIIFADPPYDLPNIPAIAQLVIQHNLLKPDGLLIIEHPSMLKLDQKPGFSECRKYGNSSFSFFRN